MGGRRVLRPGAATVDSLNAADAHPAIVAGNPGTTFTSPASFGIVSAGLNRTIGTGTARQMQFALRLSF